MTTTWKELRQELLLTPEEEAAIELEKELIQTLIKIREEKGLTQADLAQLCSVKQPVIARLEKRNHSPQINSLLKILVPLGYTLTISPLEHSAKK